MKRLVHIVITLLLVSSSLLSQKPEKYILNQDYEKAEKYCIKCKGGIQKDCYLKLAEANFKIKEYDKATTYYKLSANPSEGYDKIASVYLDHNEYEKAAAYYEQVYKTDREKLINAYIKIGNLCFEAQDLENTHEYYTKAGKEKEYWIKLGDYFLFDRNYTITNPKSSVYALTVTKDSKVIITGDANDSILFWDIETGKRLNSIYDWGFHKTDILALSNNNKSLATADNNYITIMSSESGESITSIRDNKYNNISLLRFSGDDNSIIGANYTNMIRWDIGTGGIITTYIDGHDYSVADMVVTNDNKYLISAGNDKKILLWDLETGKMLKQITKTYKEIKDIALSEDDTYLAVAGEDKDIKVFNLKSGGYPGTYKNIQGFIYSVDISADNMYMVSGGMDKTITLWDFNTGEVIKSIPCGEWLKHVIITPDNKYIVSSYTQDRHVDIWPIEGKQKIAAGYYEKANYSKGFEHVADSYMDESNYLQAAYYYRKAGQEEKSNEAYIKVAKEYAEKMKHHLEKSKSKYAEAVYYENDNWKARAVPTFVDGIKESVLAAEYCEKTMQYFYLGSNHELAKELYDEGRMLYATVIKNYSTAANEIMIVYKDSKSIGEVIASSYLKEMSVCLEKSNAFEECWEDLTSDND